MACAMDEITGDQDSRRSNGKKRNRLVAAMLQVQGIQGMIDELSGIFFFFFYSV